METHTESGNCWLCYIFLHTKTTLAFQPNDNTTESKTLSIHRRKSIFCTVHTVATQARGQLQRFTKYLHHVTNHALQNVYIFLKFLLNHITVALRFQHALRLIPIIICPLCCFKSHQGFMTTHDRTMKKMKPNWSQHRTTDHKPAEVY